MKSPMKEDCIQEDWKAYDSVLEIWYFLVAVFNDT